MRGAGKGEGKFDPDIAVTNDQSQALFLGEVKVGWNFGIGDRRDELYRYMNHPDNDKGDLLAEPIPSVRKWFGQLARYLRISGLRYGFITTYSSTVFVRLEVVRNYAYMLYSNPIQSTTSSFGGRGPLRPGSLDLVSLRECLLFYFWTTYHVSKTNRDALYLPQRLATELLVTTDITVGPEQDRLRNDMILMTKRGADGVTSAGVTRPLQGLSKRGESYELGTLYNRNVDEYDNNHFLGRPTAEDDAALADVVRHYQLQQIDVSRPSRPTQSTLVFYWDPNKRRLWRKSSEGFSVCVHIGRDRGLERWTHGTTLLGTQRMRGTSHHQDFYVRIEHSDEASPDCEDRDHFER